MQISLHIKYLLFLSDLTETWISRLIIWKILKHRMGAELETTDGRTDVTNLIVAFRYFANAPENEAFHFPAGTTFCYWILSD
jgi:hypothetical protein